MIKNQFPLVADGEPIIELSRKMSLYENEDLITNIHGFYQDKDYDDVTKDYNFADQYQSNSSTMANRQQIIDEGRSYAEEARKKARADLKQKRQTYLAKDYSHNTKSKAKKPSVQEPITTKKYDYKPSINKEHINYSAPKADSVREKTQESDNKWSRYSEKLHQESYILAEISRTYSEPLQENKTNQLKNNYDFLKRSQVYNSQENRYQKEKIIAQELNLSRLDEVN